MANPPDPMAQIEALHAEWSALPLRTESTKDDYSAMSDLAYRAIEALEALAAQPGQGEPVAFVRDWFADNGTRLGWRLEVGMNFPADTVKAGDPLFLAPPTPAPDEAGVRAEWQPIETAPKDEYVLVSCGPGGMIEACQPAEFVGKQYPWIDSYGSAVVGPEYWMPLPAPPRALAGGE